MRLLLDTHIWIWSLGDPGRLSPIVREALESDENELWLSPVSTWEALMLIERGRIRTGQDPASAVERMLESGPFREAPLTHAVAFESRRVEVEDSDPADRFIAATAVVYDLTLVTADRRLLSSESYPVMPNR